MMCERCKEDNENCAKPFSLNIDGVSFIVTRCKYCSLCMGIHLAEGWFSLDNALQRESQISGIYPAISTDDKVAHYILSQILFNEHEDNDMNGQQMIFDMPDEQDITMILWLKGAAIGFYTFKLKGTCIKETGEMYTMTTVDTIFVRKSHRRNGFCQQMMQHICTLYLDEDIGISTPISPGMKKALRKFLIDHPYLRYRIWEIQGTGGEGCRKLVWFVLTKEKNN